MRVGWRSTVRLRDVGPPTDPRHPFHGPASFILLIPFMRGDLPFQQSRGGTPAKKDTSGSANMERSLVVAYPTVYQDEEPSLPPPADVRSQ